MAVERSLGWAAVKKSDQMTGKFKNIKQLKFKILGIFKSIFFNYYYKFIDLFHIEYLFSTCMCLL